MIAGLVTPSLSAFSQPHAPDANTLLLLHLDNSFIGAAGELPLQSMGVGFEAGIFSQAAVIDGADVLTYLTSGNFNRSAGTIEFWVRPQWNGNDGAGYSIFSAGSAGSLNGGPDTLMLLKDGANNLRFRLGADDSEAYEGHNVSGWVAGQWHHIAVTWTVPGEMKTFVDSVEVISHSAGTQDLLTPAPSQMAVGSIAGVFQARAAFDEVRNSDVARTAEEIAESYVAGLTVSSLTIEPVATMMWPTWQQTPVLTAVTNLGTVRIPPLAATWSSSDTSVATVDATGRVLAISPGAFDLTATVQGTQAVSTLMVNAPLRPIEFGPIDPYLATARPGSQYEIPVVILRYLPTTDGINLDVSFDPDFWWLNPVSLISKTAQIDQFDKWLKFMVEEAARFRGYKSPQAAPAVAYRVVDYITVYEPTPPGKVLFYQGGFPVYAADFHQILERLGGQHYVEDLGVKEFWFWNGGVDAGYPSYDPAIHKPENFRSGFESNMSSPLTGDISNSDRDPADLPVYNRTYLVYGQNHRRSQAEAMHNRGHQLEAMMSHVNLLQDGNTNLFWREFVGQDAADQFITGRCGWTHMPPNTTSHYDYLNTTLVASDIEDWKPDGSGATTLVNSQTWGSIPYAWPGGPPPSQPTESQWYVYWMQNMPGLGNTIPYGPNAMTNWWRFVGDWDGSIQAGAGLYAPCTSGDPCDGIDNDCDGTADEGFALGGACDGPDGDLCLEGAMICNAAGDGTVCSDTGTTNSEVCDAQDNDCDGMIDEGIPPPAGTIQLDVAAVLLSWSAVSGATGYDVVRGNVGILRGTSGDFGMATLECLADDAASNSLAYAGVPSLGEGFWFLIRPINCGGPGSYGSPDRDAGIVECP